ncbi:MAG: FtsH protease activity modulator HflK [Treponema sp.]|nr:FtsH protease activity modulator HflK [Treponema sp.]
MSNFSPEQAAKFLKPKTLTLIILGIFFIALLGTSFYVVDQAEEAVITRLGRYRTTTGPGLRMKLPFNIDRAYIVRTREVQTEQFGFRTVTPGVSARFSPDANMSTMLTGDLNMIDVGWIIQYRITDPVAWTFNVQERRDTIRDVSQSVINMLVGDRTIMDVMGQERNAIQAAGVDLMNETFRSFNLGISVIAVQLQNTDPPAMVQAAFEDVNRAIQDMERFINEGRQAYNDLIPRTRGEADRLIQVAEGYATERVNRAHGDVARFNAVLAEYTLAPLVTRQRLYYEMMEEVFNGETGAAMIDRRFSNFLPFWDLGSNPMGGR